MARGEHRGIIERFLSVIDDAFSGLTPTGDINPERFIQDTLGLNKPITEYSPRRQRFYLHAARNQQTAKEANREDYRKRVSRQERIGAAPKERKRPPNRREIALGINRQLADVGITHDMEFLNRMGKTVGWDNLASVLTEQRNALVAYAQGDTGPGRALWERRNEIIAQLYADGEYEGTDADELFYYHGTS